MTWGVSVGLWALGIGLCARSAHTRPGPEPALRSSTRTVRIAEFRFSPAELTVSPGDTVEWSNGDQFFHTTRADSGAWSSPELRQGERFRMIADRVGRFPYHCAAHPVMRGIVVVTR